ncbi:MAG: L-histidine N(alpha)-methyltransferase [Sphingomonadaceae bacterium]
MATVAETAAAEGLHDAFRASVLEGLAQPQKTIPARWFYDMRGSELFEQITELPEYYPTRTEIGILQQCCPKIAEETGTGGAVVEFGAGSVTKIPLLLDAVKADTFVPIDISGDFLSEAVKPLAERYPAMRIFPVEADFTKPVTMPREIAGEQLFGFFPGSTIGNMEPMAAVDLLRSMHDTLGAGAWLVIGFDRIKDRQVLIDAYDDAAGVTAAFNLNVIERINRELGGTVPIDALRHKAVWNDARARIEMHIEAMRDIAFEVAGAQFAMAKGETIHTENSHKYGKRIASMMLLAGGWEPVRTFTDEGALFMVILARAMPDTITA